MFFTDISKMVFPIGRQTPTGINLLGTAFLINKQGILATAAHVTCNNDDGLIVIVNNITSIQDFQDTSVEKVQYIFVKIKEINPFCDICLLEIATPVQSMFTIGSAGSLQVGEEVSLFGYPHCDHGRMILTQQNTSVGAKIKIKVSGIMVNHIVLNIQSRPGQSGSPIIAPSSRNIDAILIGSYAPKEANGVISIGGIDPQTLHQTTHAVSAEYIEEMMR